MLQQLSITNYQRLARLELNFTGRILTIVGANDSGKSTTIRALKWVCLNQQAKRGPRFANHIRYGRKFATVILRLDDRKVKRTSGSKGNTYSLDKRKYSAVGTDVPESVANVVRMSPINFQNQLDAHLWFSLSPGQVAKELNLITDLEIMDRSMAVLGQQLRKAKLAHEIANERFRKLRTEQLSLRWIRPAWKAHQVIEQIDEQVERLTTKQQTLTSIVKQHDKLTANIYDYETADADGRELLRLEKEHQDKADQCDELDDLLRRLDFARELSRVEIPDLSPIERIDSKLERLANEREQLSELIDKHRRASTELKQIDSELESFDKGVCPTCHRPL